jgi:hypothetical protein
MVFQILKNIVKLSVVLATGAALGIWFAPPSAKALMKQKLAVAQKSTKGIQSDANKYWTANLQKKMETATKTLDPRQIDRKVVDEWYAKSKHAVGSISANAKRTQETLVKANQIIQSAKSEYRQYGTMFGM